ncbi:transposase [Streptomyces hirsutus]|uniref:transposase n=1 Tax=Streptomyces hirsutus TaxID=35620 RepID=UPI00341B2DEE
MADMQNIRTGRHCAFTLHAHVVFGTNHRHKVFNDAHLKRTEEIMRAVCEDVACESGRPMGHRPGRVRTSRTQKRTPVRRQGLVRQRPTSRARPQPVARSRTP